MYACYEPTMFAFEPVFRRPRYSACAPCTPSVFFLLPFLLFIAGPLLMMIVLTIKAIFFFFAPLIFMALAFKAVHCASSWPFFKTLCEADHCADDKPTYARCRRFPASACAAACTAPADKEKTMRGEKSADDKAEEDAAASYEIHIAAPGVRAADVTATLDHANLLRVSGRSATFGGKSVASVDRSVRLPADADVDRIALSVADGLVRVTVDKKAPRVLRVLPTATSPAAEAASSAAPSGEAPKGRAIPIDKKGAAEPERMAPEGKAAPSSDDKDKERQVHETREKKTQTVVATAGKEAEASDGASSEDDSAGFVEISRKVKKVQ